mgnify:CR=1 FL=1
MYCKNCGNEVKSSDKYCKVCGAAQPAPTTTKKDQESYHETSKNTSTPDIVIAALVLSFLVPIVGLILSLAARSNSKDLKERDNQMITVALIVSAIRLAMSFISIFCRLLFRFM